MKNFSPINTYISDISNQCKWSGKDQANLVIAGKMLFVPINLNNHFQYLSNHLCQKQMLEKRVSKSNISFCIHIFVYFFAEIAWEAICNILHILWFHFSYGAFGVYCFWLVIFEPNGIFTFFENFKIYFASIQRILLNRFSMIFVLSMRIKRF